MKLIFYPGRHGLTRIDPVNSVLVKNDSFDPKRPETHFLPWSTWFDPYWPGELSFGQKWRFWPETAQNSFFTLVDMVWPVLTRWTRFWPKMTVLTENSFFTPVDIVWPVLTRWNRFLWKDAVDSRKIYFFEFSFFLIFLDFYK